MKIRCVNNIFQRGFLELQLAFSCINYTYLSDSLRKSSHLLHSQLFTWNFNIFYACPIRIKVECMYSWHTLNCCQDTMFVKCFAIRRSRFVVERCYFPLLLLLLVARFTCKIVTHVSRHQYTKCEALSISCAISKWKGFVCEPLNAFLFYYRYLFLIYYFLRK